MISECLSAVVCLNFCVSGNFPETAWRVMSHRQAAHLFIRVLGVLGGEPPGGTFPAARRRFGVTLNFWVADEAPGGTG